MRKAKAVGVLHHVRLAVPPPLRAAVAHRAVAMNPVAKASSGAKAHALRAAEVKAPALKAVLIRAGTRVHHAKVHLVVIAVIAVHAAMAMSCRATSTL